MNVYRIINNNVVSAFDAENREVVVMGRGIGYKAHQKDLIDETKIEKIFRIENPKLSSSFKEILANMPLEHIQLAAKIISYAEDNLHIKLNQGIYVTLTDHIDFAIQRYRQGVKLANALLWEIKQYYEKEFLLGKHAVSLINKSIGTDFTDDEAGFIALHFVNAEYDTSLNDTYTMSNMVQEILNIVKKEMNMEFDEESVHYERFLTHLKFLARRVFKHEFLTDEESEVAKMMKGKYPREYECSKKIAAFIEEKYKSLVSDEEIIFLAVHIKRVYSNDKKEN